MQLLFIMAKYGIICIKMYITMWTGRGVISHVYIEIYVHIYIIEVDPE